MWEPCPWEELEGEPWQTDITVVYPVVYNGKEKPERKLNCELSLTAQLPQTVSADCCEHPIWWCCLSGAVHSSTWKPHQMLTLVCPGLHWELQTPPPPPLQTSPVSSPWIFQVHDEQCSVAFLFTLLLWLVTYLINSSKAKSMVIIVVSQDWAEPDRVVNSLHKMLFLCESRDSH